MPLNLIRHLSATLECKLRRYFYQSMSTGMCGWSLGLYNVTIFVLCTDICAFRIILFTPFVPFIVIFCHTIETRDKEDLSRMYAFLKSIECACQHSNAIAKHHHLFGVLYSVALRYTELGLPSTPMEEEQLQLRSEVDAHLSSLGLQPQIGLFDDNDLSF